MTALFYWTGVVVFGGSCMALCLALIAAVWWFLWSPFGPMFHLGKPKLECRLSFYSNQYVLAKKGGGTFTEFDRKPRLDHYFDVPWFWGLSTRKGHFLLGMLRLRRAQQ